MEPLAASGPIELVIFDCDGVLVDSERLAVKVDVRVLATLGWQITEEEVVHRFVGLSNESMAREIERHIGRQLPPDWDSNYDHLYREAFERELKPVPGVVDALSQISISTCVASSGSHEKMRFTLGLTGLLETFEGRIYSASEVTRGKPAPDLFLHAANRMGVRPEACAVIEDSRFGVRAAKAAGMMCFGYAGGISSVDSLQAEGATTFVDMEELPNLLGLC